MRSLALVAIVTLAGSCVPVPSKRMATIGNVAALATSIYVAHGELERDCERAPTEDERINCHLDSPLTLATAEIVAMGAFLGLLRTLAAKRAP